MERILKHILAAALAVAYSLAAAAQHDGPPVDFDGIVRFDETIHDFGDVIAGQGELKCTFTATNISKAAIVIYNVVTSCGCTDVSWTREPVKPGEAGKISATYNNSDGPYPFDKTLTVYISGVKKPIVLRIKGVAHAKKRPLSELYPERRGIFALKKGEFQAGNLSQGGQKAGKETVANVGTTPAEVTFSNLSPGLSISVSPNPVPSGETAMMTYVVTADRSRWGRNCYSATPIVNGQAREPLKIWAFTKEDFSGWTAARQENGARPLFETSSYDFGKVRKGTSVSAGFTFSNLGGETFRIYKADPESDAVTVPSVFPDVASGEKGTLTFRLDTSGLPCGDNDIAVVLTTNSPLRPVISLYISGNIY